MGDRGNIRIEQGSEVGDVWLYSHWGGSDLAEELQRALARGLRWDDPAYLARIVFDAMTEGQVGEATGYGISTWAQDNEHAILRVTLDGQVQVTTSERPVGDPGVVRTMAIQDFVKLDPSQLQAFYEPDKD